MRRALGPFLTTGVALVAATVVVANPVAPPSRDMQISTTQLSTSPDLLSPSDKSLLSALTPQLPVAGLGPALAQILAALAADADRISREVVSDVEPPAAASPLAEQTAYHVEQVVGPVLESPNPAPTAATMSFSPTSVTNDVVDALNGLVLDTSYLGGKVVEAAFTLVDVIIRTPQFLVTAFVDLLNGDVAGAMDTVKSAIKAFFGPGLILLDGIRDVLYGRQLPAMALPSAAKVLSAPSSETKTDKPAPDTSGTPSSSRDGAKAESARKRDETPSTVAALRSAATATIPKSAASSGQTATAPKAHSSSKPAAGSTRAGAGSARDSKSSAGAGSSSD
ncbi:hypothetical protein ACTXG7_22485 [Mycolicibacterium sp. Dal123E01]|uniref:hypothetical protein n=1 Tax=Mycolicibacterium sp. Dal123E01 TaxID=3457578 RepID=UPI00403EF6B0